MSWKHEHNIEYIARSVYQGWKKLAGGPAVGMMIMNCGGDGDPTQALTYHQHNNHEFPRLAINGSILAYCSRT